MVVDNSTLPFLGFVTYCVVVVVVGGGGGGGGGGGLPASLQLHSVYVFFGCDTNKIPI